MVHSDHESLTEQDPHALLFGHDDHVDHDDGSVEPEPYPPSGRASHRAEDPLHRSRARLHRRAYAVMALVVVIVVSVVGYVGYTKYENRYHPKDFSGAQGAAVLIRVGSGDGADAIGKTLVNAKVVETVRAFANAAGKNPAAQNIQPGTYKLHLHMSSAAALAALLDPASRIANDAVVFEGATIVDVQAQLAKALGVGAPQVHAALNDVSVLNLPAGYANHGAAPSSVEGFLFPATYSFDAGTSPPDALTQMITKFIDEDRSTHFAQDAKAINLTPYEALTIASIAEKEAKVAADYPKVARVILNRIAAGMPLQIDATSAYAAKLQNLDPTKVIYATINSPYNTYTHQGLPPSPISNPGLVAMNAAVHPASGDWLYYVNGDQAGDLVFTSSATQFAADVQRCRENHWGCA